MVYRICVVMVAALLAGPALASGEYKAASQDTATFDGGSNSAYPGRDDGSVVNPDGEDDVDSGDSGGDEDGADDGDDSPAPVTYPA